MNVLDEIREIRSKWEGWFGEPGGSRRKATGYAVALASGALLGGVALSLLNRKAIQSLQDELKKAPVPSEDDIY